MGVMPLTKGFKELVKGRVASDPEFTIALLREGLSLKTLNALCGVQEAPRVESVPNGDIQKASGPASRALGDN